MTKSTPAHQSEYSRQCKNPPIVAAGQKYTNPYDVSGGAGYPIIRILLVEGDEAVCAWRYANNPDNRLQVFVKSCKAILEDWKIHNDA